MADLTVQNSGYQTGEIDTARTLEPGLDMKRAQHHNGPNSAIVQIETILGLGPDLIGTLTDLVARLSVSLNTNGTLKLATAGATGGTGGLDGNLLIGNSLTGGWDQGVLFPGHGLDRTVGNGTLKLDTHLSLVVFDTTGTFTVPVGVTQLVVRVWGASGGNGGSGGGGNGNAGDVTAGGNGGNGGRGAAGSYAEDITPVVAGTVYTVTIGQGGAIGSAGAGAGGPGGTGGPGQTTSFGGLISITGSVGGVGGTGGQAGQVAASGTRGADGLPGATYGVVSGTLAARINIRGAGRPESADIAIGGAGGDTAGSVGLAGAAGSAGGNGLVAVAY